MTSEKRALSSRESRQYRRLLQRWASRRITDAELPRFRDLNARRRNPEPCNCHALSVLACPVHEKQLSAIDQVREDLIAGICEAMNGDPKGIAERLLDKYWTDRPKLPKGRPAKIDPDRVISEVLSGRMWEESPK